MHDLKSVVPTVSSVAPERNAAPPRQPIAFLIAVAALVVLFGHPLLQLARFAAGSTLYSHIPLVPLVSGFLAWRRWDSRAQVIPRATLPALLAMALALLVLIGYWVAESREITLTPETSLAFTTAAFVLLVVAAAAWFLGHPRLRTMLFPLCFLVFMIPVPSAWVVLIESGLQHGSAGVARGLFTLSGTATFYDNLDFQLPGINLRVAPECSGIHSTLALLMVALVAGHVFLRSPRRAALLGMAVVPLALLRNGLRIYTVGELCVHRGPAMIDSPIHRSGGPLFFALSLVPFFALLWLLLRHERTR